MAPPPPRGRLGPARRDGGRGGWGRAPPTPPEGAARPVPARSGPRAASSCPYVLTGGAERRGRQQPRGRAAPARCRRAAGAVQKGGGCAQKRLGAGGEGTRDGGEAIVAAGLQRTPRGVGVAAAEGTDSRREITEPVLLTPERSERSGAARRCCLPRSVLQTAQPPPESAEQNRKHIPVHPDTLRWSAI